MRCRVVRSLLHSFGLGKMHLDKSVLRMDHVGSLNTTNGASGYIDYRHIVAAPRTEKEPWEKHRTAAKGTVRFIKIGHLFFGRISLSFVSTIRIIISTSTGVSDGFAISTNRTSRESVFILLIICFM